MPDRILAIDWSGAKVGSERRIWMAEVVVGQVVRLASGRTREEVIDDVVSVGVTCRQSGEQLIVGLDFSFGFPGWFARECGADDGNSLWAATATSAEAWLSLCEPPFWGRPGKPNPNVGERGFRHTELALRPRFAPKSTFQIGGAGSVGTGSLRGIPFLLPLVAAGFSIWPFDPVGQLTVVEMYPRMHTGPVVKSNELARREYLRGAGLRGAGLRGAGLRGAGLRGAGLRGVCLLDAGLAETNSAGRDVEIPLEFLERAAGSEDAFDALLSAIGMWQRVASGHTPPDPATLPGEAAIEGWIW